MQRDAGLRGIFSSALPYALFQNLVGASRSRKWAVSHCLRLKGGEKLVDVGCGPGVLLDYLQPDIQYLGFDISRNYLETARHKYGARGLFLEGRARDFVQDDRFQRADHVYCSGLLHHLDDDEVLEVFRFAHTVLKPSGRFTAIEPCFLAHQGRFSHWLMRQDRGANVRYEDDWKRLACQVFPSSHTRVLTRLIRIPYIHIWIEGGRGSTRRTSNNPEST
ncbi:MAG TPA: class I SAM-dependent methyltransferase [Candidatus Paceibacterota bacterium]|nr:class I SAM-dependent methyltransferase [Verrucomicrobiota bacterium]HRY49376.1 class I SAM-dependent methyltransferase [Candidatus Paceibacterota bacterium]